jgi:predicted CoA-binding protein
MNHEAYSDAYVRGVLSSTETIAMVGASANAARPSYGVMQFLLQRGFRVTPINPGLAGQDLQGQKVYASLHDVPHAIDMVDVFRAGDAVAALVDEILQLPTLPKVLWMQLGVFDAEAAAKAEAKGIKVVMNRCPVIEMHRLAL